MRKRLSSRLTLLYKLKGLGFLFTFGILGLSLTLTAHFLFIIPLILFLFIYNPIGLILSSWNVSFDENYLYRRKRQIALKDINKIKRIGLITFLITYKKGNKGKFLFVVPTNFISSFNLIYLIKESEMIEELKKNVYLSRQKPI